MGLSRPGKDSACVGTWCFPRACIKGVVSPAYVQWRTRPRLVEALVLYARGVDLLGALNNSRSPGTIFSSLL